jgi:hypothetical protein
LAEACDESDVGVSVERSTAVNDEIDGLLPLLVEPDVDVEEELELGDDAASACNSGSEAAALVLLSLVLPDPLALATWWW